MEEQNTQKVQLPKAEQGPGLATLLQQKVHLEEQIQEQFFREKTFMAIDVQKSTELKKGKAKEDIFLTFDAYHQMVKTCAESNAGQVHETAGDGIMCVFDSADGACKAGIAIITSLPEFNQTLNRLKKPVVLRIGLNSGRVLFDQSRSIGELFDGVIDVAGHLQKEGKGGDLFITQATYDAVADKGLFIKDKYWEPKQTQLYRYGVQAGVQDASPADGDDDAEYRDLEKFTPVLDAVSGKSSREIHLGDLLWVKRPTGVFAEGKVTMCQSDTDFCRLIVALPDGILAYAKIRVSLRICTSFDRAEIFARKTMVSPELMRFTGEAASSAGPAAAGMAVPPYVLWGGVALVGLLFLVVLVLMLVRSFA